MKNLIIASMLVFSIVGCHEEEEAADCAEAVVAEEEVAEEESDAAEEEADAEEEEAADEEAAEEEAEEEAEESEEEEAEEEEEAKMLEEEKSDSIDDLAKSLATLKKHGINVYTGKKATPAPAPKAEEQAKIDFLNVSKSLEEIDRMEANKNIVGGF